MIGTSPVIDTRDGLKAYILRQLGDPVVNVEVHDSQLEDSINETIAEFVPHSDDGLEKRFRVIQLDCDKLIYDLDYTTYAVLGLYQSDALDYSPAPSDLFSVNQHIANDLISGGLGRVDLLTLELVQEQIASMKVVFGKRIEYNYNAITKQLYLDSNPAADSYYQGWSGTNPRFVFMEYYKTIDYSTDPSVQQNIYDVKWVQQYSTALARRQWGINMMKYEGSPLPNGMTINASAMIDMAEKSKETLMEQLREEWQEPTDFFIG